jgi:dsRNA-specific ribonuclease
VTIGGAAFGQGTGPSKQQAAQAAANDALNRLEALESGLPDTHEHPVQSSEAT